MATAPPGWYPDPQDPPGSQRYWNGSTWTEHVQAPGYMPPPPPPPTSSGQFLASYGQRVGGWLLDWLIVWAVSIPVAILVGGYHNRIINPNGSGTYYSNSYGVHWWGLLVAAALVVGYGTVFCGSNGGQTLGMMVVGVRAVDAASGEPIGYRRAFGRALLEYVLVFAFFLPWVLDMLFPLWDRKNQTLHDKAVRSVAINKSVGYP